MKKICKNCGKEFEIASGEIQFYKSKNLELPKRCKECRDKNKKNHAPHSQAKSGKAQSARVNAYQNTKATDSAQPAKQMSGNPKYDVPKSDASKNSRNIKTRLSAAIAAIFILLAGLFGGRFLDLDNNNNAPNANVSKQQNAGSDHANEPDISYTFRNDDYLEQHFEKHKEDFDYRTKEEYLSGANRVIASKDALHNIEKEDGDDVYYLEATNEFVIVSTDGYIRTYFKPNDGIAYFHRQTE